MSKYNYGEVWIGKLGTKNRPMLIIGKHTATEIDRTVAKITSQDARDEYDLELTYWEEAGLREPSIVRCSKISTISSMNLHFKIGEIHDDDLSEVKKALADYLGL